MRLLSLTKKRSLYFIIIFPSDKELSANEKKKGREKERVENLEKSLTEKEAWEKSSPSHKVIQKEEEKFENKFEKNTSF